MKRQTMGSIIASLVKTPEMLEDFYESLNREDRRVFRDAMDALRKKHSKNKTLETWYHRLHTAPDAEDIKQEDLKLEKLASKFTLIFGTAVGSITGIIAWFLIRWQIEAEETLSIVQNTTMFSAIALIAIAIFVFGNYPKVKNLKLAGGTVVGCVLLVGMFHVLSRGDFFEGFGAGSIIVLTVIAVVLLTASARDKGWKHLPKSIHWYVKKFI